VRQVGDRSENMEQSVAHFEAALGVLRQLRASGEAPKHRPGGGAGVKLRPHRDTTPHVSSYDRARDDARPRPQPPPGAEISRAVSRSALPPGRHAWGYAPAAPAQVRERPPPMAPLRGPLPTSSSPPAPLPPPPAPGSDRAPAPPPAPASRDANVDPGQAAHSTVSVRAAVPEGAHAGDVLYVKGPGGAVYALPLPVGASPGQTVEFQVTEKPAVAAAEKKQQPGAAAEKPKSSSWLGLGGTVGKTGVSGPASDSEQETVTVTVPPDAKPGSELEVKPPSCARAFSVVVPAGHKPGSTFTVKVPPENRKLTRQTMSITIPEVGQTTTFHELTNRRKSLV
jgi:hypothetical protein